jgi:hypothetical protein
MRTLALDELQFVSGGSGDLPQAPDVYTIQDMLWVLENLPPPFGTIAFAGQLVYNTGASVQFGLTAMIWGVGQLVCW